MGTGLFPDRRHAKPLRSQSGVQVELPTQPIYYLLVSKTRLFIHSANNQVHVARQVPPKPMEMCCHVTDTAPGLLEPGGSWGTHS